MDFANEKLVGDNLENWNWDANFGFWKRRNVKKAEHVCNILGEFIHVKGAY